MIIDTIEKLSFYESLNPLFKEVADFLKNNDLNTLEEGKHFIKGDDLFVNIQRAKGKTRQEARLESHRRMLDIQIPLSTAEDFGYTPCSELPAADYNEAKDISFYEGLAQTYVTCKPGQMVIFWPQDGHAPCISEEKEIKKAIFKVRV
ncbi:MAG: YhcH/YjgK/YiaL family protein [Prevotella sp.]|nr:YhcH/YjgK/YiaL family protein [Prevotella sp.]